MTRLKSTIGDIYEIQHSATHACRTRFTSATRLLCPDRVVSVSHRADADVESAGTAGSGCSERSEDWENNLKRLARKFETARNLVPKPVVDEVEDAKIAIISIGSNDPAVQEARQRLAKAGVETSYMRLRALPISDSVRDFIASYDQVYVVENNFDGQLHKILLTETPASATRLVSVSKCDGMALSARFITESILAKK